MNDIRQNIIILTTYYGLKLKSEPEWAGSNYRCFASSLWWYFENCGTLKRWGLAGWNGLPRARHERNGMHFLSMSGEQSQWQAPRVRQPAATATMPSPLWGALTSDITVQRNLSSSELLLSDSITVMKKLMQRIGIKSGVIDVLNLARGLFILWNWLMGKVWMSLELWSRKAWRFWKLSLMGCSQGNIEEQNTEMRSQDCAYEVSNGCRDSVKSWTSSHSCYTAVKNLFYREIFVNIQK